MGWGDEIMVTGEVKRRAAGTSRRFAILDAKQRVRWDPIWDGNPRIARPGEPYDDAFLNGPGNRPYIYWYTSRQWYFKEYRPTSGEIFLSDNELRFGRKALGAVLIQPTLKSSASPNKEWGRDRWQKLVSSRKDLPWLQIGGPGTSRLRGVDFIETRTFRLACACMAHVKAAVTHEGGTHHALAALGIPAVVIFGGFIAPSVTGYDLHRNLYTADNRYPYGCGLREVCIHCVRAMEQITVDRVKRELESILEGDRS